MEFYFLKLFLKKYLTDRGFLTFLMKKLLIKKLCFICFFFLVKNHNKKAKALRKIPAEVPGASAFVVNFSGEAKVFHELSTLEVNLW